jgi:hypothetical protein
MSAEQVTRGVRNNNPGNIRIGDDWQGIAKRSEMTAAQKAEKSFVVFTDPVYGIRAIGRILLNYQSKRNRRSVKTMLNRWAPPNENNTPAYVAAVARAMGISPDDQFDMRDYRFARPMIEAIIAHECAGYAYPEDVVNHGILHAGIEIPDA